MHLLSSNPKKLEEYARYGLALEMREGEDLPEVDGNIEEIALYKAKMAGPGAVVEDTVVIVDGTIWNDIKWKKHLLPHFHGKSIVQVITLGHNTGTHIELYQARLEGIITTPTSERAEAFGFDAYMIPKGETLSLDELEQLSRKDEFSPRRGAAEALKNKQTLCVTLIDDIPQWLGAWQNPETVSVKIKL